MKLKEWDVSGRIGLAENDHGTTVTVFVCSKCGDVFTVTGEHTTDSWGGDCLSEECDSYDVSRDADLMFGLEPWRIQRDDGGGRMNDLEKALEWWESTPQFNIQISRLADAARRFANLTSPETIEKGADAVEALPYDTLELRNWGEEGVADPYRIVAEAVLRSVEALTGREVTVLCRCKCHEEELRWK